MIEVFTTNSCASCKMVKRFLDYKQMKYEERNLDHDPSLLDRVATFGLTSVPVTVFSNGGEITKVVSGYSPQQLLA